MGEGLKRAFAAAKATRVNYTKEMLKEFDRLTMDCSSSNQVARVSGRLNLRKFIEKHGKEVCDEMYAAIQAKEQKKYKRAAKFQ